jgi:hypothetical protein
MREILERQLFLDGECLVKQILVVLVDSGSGKGLIFDNIVSTWIIKGMRIFVDVDLVVRVTRRLDFEMRFI